MNRFNLGSGTTNIRIATCSVSAVFVCFVVFQSAFFTNFLLPNFTILSLLADV